MHTVADYHPVCITDSNLQETAPAPRARICKMGDGRSERESRGWDVGGRGIVRCLRDFLVKSCGGGRSGSAIGASSSGSLLRYPTSNQICMTGKTGNTRSMPICRNCEHSGRTHNWISAACSNCGNRRRGCSFCFGKYQQGRLRGQCQHPGCTCGKYVPLTDQPSPVNKYAARLLYRKRGELR